MFSSFTSKVHITKFCAILALLALLTGCGNTPTSPPAQTPTATFANSQQGTLLLPNTGAAFDSSGLLHVETSGIRCPIDNWPAVESTLTLSTDRLTYDSGEIQGMAAYVDGKLTSQNPSPPLPNTLQVVLGSLYGGLGSWHIVDAGCTMRMEITNIGKTSFQISQMALRLTANPQQNNYHYRLIDICSLPLPAQDLLPCHGQRGGGESATVYEIKLKMGSTDTVFQGQTSSLPPTIDPGQSASVVFFIEPSDRLSSFMYSAIPEITLDLSGEERSIQLTQLQSRIAFVTLKQLVCYRLQGTTFVPLDLGPHDDTWCL
jgi:hypothetical protein